MPDVILDEQGQPLQQPATVDKARFDGLVRKVEELTLSNRNLTAQLGTLSSEKEQLGAQLGIKDIEKSAAILERDNQLKDVVTQKTATEHELNELRAMKTKLKVAREMGRPDLIDIFDTIPAVADEETLKTIFGTIGKFADNAVKAREQQLMSGITPAVSSASQSKSSAPNSSEAWAEHIRTLRPDSAEYAKARDAEWKWLAENNK